MNKLRLPDLTFEHVQFGQREVPWNLAILLYRGGAASPSREVSNLIASGALEQPYWPRLSVLSRIHENIQAQLTAGGSKGTAATRIRRLREFYSWGDRNSRALDSTSLVNDYLDWAEYLLEQSKYTHSIGDLHAYQSAVTVAVTIEEALFLPRRTLIRRSRLKRPASLKSKLGTCADKQDLSATFKLGRVLQDIITSLTVEAIKGPLPVLLKFRSGEILEEWTRLRPPESNKTLSPDMKPSTRAAALAKRSAWQADASLRTRHSLLNLRIQAELLIFIAQTGMNLEQAHSLRLSKFRYKSHLDGYQVYRVYKCRRQGEVEFEIFSEYRDLFEAYINWRNAFFPASEDALLFPMIRSTRLASTPPDFWMVDKVCKKLGVALIRSRQLRSTRVNWILRQSGNPDLTAELHSHTRETLLRTYERPNYQLALTEITNFHSKHAGFPASPGPGACATRGANPQPIPSAPSNAPQPDCISPAGCLFCSHNRDLDSKDHVWSLASFRHLKSLELTRYRPDGNRRVPHPANAAIDQITLKLQAFGESSSVRQSWVSEALLKMAEEHYHPRWEGFISLLESRK